MPLGKPRETQGGGRCLWSTPHPGGGGQLTMTAAANDLMIDGKQSRSHPCLLSREDGTCSLSSRCSCSVHQDESVFRSPSLSDTVKLFRNTFSLNNTDCKDLKGTPVLSFSFLWTRLSYCVMFSSRLYLCVISTTLQGLNGNVEILILVFL